MVAAACPKCQTPLVCFCPKCRASVSSEKKTAANKLNAAKPRPRKCGASTLCPDDIIRPCVLPREHDGFCSGGVK